MQVDQAAPIEKDGADSEMPSHYRKVEIKYSRFGVEDFDFGSVTPLLPLVTSHALSADSTTRQSTRDSKRTSRIPTPTRSFKHCTISSRSRSSLRRIRCRRARRRTVFSARWDSCFGCLEMGRERIVRRVTSPELSALARRVSLSLCFSLRGTILRLVYLVAALGLMDHDHESSTIAYASLIQTFNRFLLEQMTAESDQPGRNPLVFKSSSSSLGPPPPSNPRGRNGKSAVATSVRSPLTQLLRVEARSVSTCQCGGTTARESPFNMVDLIYPRRVSSAIPLQIRVEIDIFGDRRCRTKSLRRRISQRFYETRYSERRSLEWSVQSVANRTISESSESSNKPPPPLLLLPSLPRHRRVRMINYRLVS